MYKVLIIIKNLYFKKNRKYYLIIKLFQTNEIYYLSYFITLKKLNLKNFIFIKLSYINQSFKITLEIHG